MKVVIRRVKEYRCETCHTTYSNKKRARECEARPVEEKTFKVGQKVRGIEMRECLHGVIMKAYTMEGIVKKIIGPELPDEEYENKWLGASRDRLRSHVLLYNVQFRCPHCRKVKLHMYYAPELRPVVAR